MMPMLRRFSNIALGRGSNAATPPPTGQQKDHGRPAAVHGQKTRVIGSTALRLWGCVSSARQGWRGGPNLIEAQLRNRDGLRLSPRGIRGKSKINNTR